MIGALLALLPLLLLPRASAGEVAESVGGARPEGALGVQVASSQSQPSHPTPPEARGRSNWTLIWSDDFTADKLDPTKWRAEDAAVSNNQELQYYTPDAISIRDGILTIRAERRSLNGREYTSALFDSRGLFSMAFGRFECRAKLPKGQGMWPAIWMLPEDDRWPPEIDIMENLGQEPQRIHTTHHWGPSWPKNQKTGGHSDGPDYSADFHTFAVEWSPDKIDWLIDGERKFTSTANIPQDPMYLIFNLAVGGNWGGNPDKTTQFPQEFQLDWVRAYQRTDPAQPTLQIDSVNGETLPEPRRWAFKPNEKVRLTADPAIGYVFKEWKGAASGTTNPLDLTMDASKRVTAIFAPAPDAPKLLSRNRPARASSTEGWGTEAERAVDASLWTRWAAKPADPLWLEVDLGEPRKIEAVRLAWTDAPEASYTIEVSDDQKTWKPATPSRRATIAREKITGLNAEGRYARIYLRDLKPNNWCSLFSFEIYGR